MAVGSAQVAVSTTAVQLTAAESDSRVGESVAVTNTHASATVYLGGAGVTSSTGFPLVAGGSLSVDLDGTETLYGITASGSVTVGVLRTSV
jgi:hypothetical protein